ncbi:MAG TPA: M28 family metallopeptidase [Balneolales bacterium]|nr:M28 family metallopeptidase [Balneolales bacterium]
MKYRLVCMSTITALFLVSCSSSRAQDKPNPAKADPVIGKMLTQISADSIKANILKLVSFNTRQTLSDTLSNTTGIGAARRWIYSKFEQYGRESGGRLKVGYEGYVQQPEGRIDRPTKIVDVIAVLHGSQTEASNRIYIVSGHYDSRVTDIMNRTSEAPGADDDGSGTAASLEMARVMSRYHFDATIIFAAVAGEEQGLYGSTHLADIARKKNWDVAAMFTNDIIGSPAADNGTRDPNTVRVFAQGIPPKKELSDYDRMLLRTGGENDTPPRELAREIMFAAKKYDTGMNVMMIYRNDRYLRGGDHMPFLAKGYPAVRFTETHEDFRHQHQDVRLVNGVQYGDLPGFVDYKYVARVTRVNAAALAEMASAPARPANPGMDVSKLTNSTTLLWNANHEPDLAGYRIVWRRTTSPGWQHSKFVGKDTTYTLKDISKDNYLFGIQSVDNNGHVSPAVYPLPVFNR